MSFRATEGKASAFLMAGPLASRDTEQRAFDMWNGGAGSDKIDARTKGACLALQHQTAVPDGALAWKATARLRLPHELLHTEYTVPTSYFHTHCLMLQAAGKTRVPK
jgi:hypothetical protein